ncbi:MULTISPECIES: J domain-containing protein [Arthrobacter]|uniref:J domain-containing protein n=2 Tax=Arthrobacter TaxID=1663 RepID=A0ABU9KK15_9MICC|nr:J domain-containing protein [Arthrobacter sp. YJM1]MDP5227206.1 J domain-containing protein [Arthrobacter sp. YJM1]
MAAARGASHYEVLGVAVTASTQEIKVAYRKAARITHPDHGGDPERFRAVTRAYEVLVDEKARAAYDAGYGALGRPAAERDGERGVWESGATAHTTSRPAGPRAKATDPAVFVPPLGRPGGLLPDEVARLQMHGMPRKRGIFGAEARIRREQRAMSLLLRHVVAPQPSARLVNGLKAPDGRTYIDHAILAGYRLALVDSMALPAGAYAWDGERLLHGGRSVLPPLLAHSVRHIQDLFPELHVTGWTMVLGPDDNLHDPVIDRRPGSSGLVEVGNAAGTIRGLREFLGNGPQPNAVHVPSLARLVRGMH